MRSTCPLCFLHHVSQGRGREGWETGRSGWKWRSSEVVLISMGAENIAVSGVWSLLTGGLTDRQTDGFMMDVSCPCVGMKSLF